MPAASISGSAVSKEESVRKDPAYAVYETYRYAYERYGYLFSYAEKTEEKENTASDGTEAVQAGAENMLSAASLARLQDYDYLMKQYFSVCMLPPRQNAAS